MRIWSEKLIPKLCQKHLCAMWREGLGAYKIITENRTDLSYWKHPATQEFVMAPRALYHRLSLVRQEMLNRGYHPKELQKTLFINPRREHLREWQTLEQQIKVIRSKKCECKIK